ncbi:uncharacterized protein LOC127241355 [Andrographis paniculata]|uniref:uncharacterized protein LOC127241355 n=1 Tax=Andrographis paniculata TaxID=175694 RepID=UPI0021E90046|nr:uncharacterized protein LOC127241355 [Andrographis paniculata]
MKVGVWNIRGIHQAPKKIDLMTLVKDHSLQLFGVLETKCTTKYFDDFLQRKLPGWNSSTNFHCIKGGHIAVFWNPSTASITDIVTKEQCITLDVTSRVSATSVIISFAYGFNSLVKRRGLWNSLLCLGASLQKPWLILGDFNSVLEPSGRICGSIVRPYDYKDFLSCVTALGLSDLPSSGCCFTWKNNRVWSKLDQAMVNHSWLSSNFVSSVAFLPAGFSDHSPAIVSLFDHVTRKGSPFKFFNMWTTHPSFLDYVKAAWDQPVYGSVQFKLVSKLKLVKIGLSSLNKLHYSHILERAKAASDALKQPQVESDAAPGLYPTENMLALKDKAIFLQQAAVAFALKKRSINIWYLTINAPSSFIR